MNFKTFCKWIYYYSFNFHSKSQIYSLNICFNDRLNKQKYIFSMENRSYNGETGALLHFNDLDMSTILHMCVHEPFTCLLYYFTTLVTRKWELRHLFWKICYKIFVINAQWALLTVCVYNKQLFLFICRQSVESLGYYCSRKWPWICWVIHHFR